MIASSQHGDGLNLLEEANTKDNQNGKIYFAMLLCDLTVNSASKFTKLGFDFTRSTNYQHAFIQYYFNKMF